MAAQLLERLAGIGAAAHGRVQAATLGIGAKELIEALHLRHRALRRQCLLDGGRANGDATSTRRGFTGFCSSGCVVSSRRYGIGNESAHWRTGTFQAGSGLVLRGACW